MYTLYKFHFLNGISEIYFLKIFELYDQHLYIIILATHNSTVI